MEIAAELYAEFSAQLTEAASKISTSIEKLADPITRYAEAVALSTEIAKLKISAK